MQHFQSKHRQHEVFFFRVPRPTKSATIWRSKYITLRTHQLLFQHFWLIFVVLQIFISTCTGCAWEQNGCRVVFFIIIIVNFDLKAHNPRRNKIWRSFWSLLNYLFFFGSTYLFFFVFGFDGSLFDIVWARSKFDIFILYLLSVYWLKI